MKVSILLAIALALATPAWAQSQTAGRLPPDPCGKYDGREYDHCWRYGSVPLRDQVQPAGWTAQQRTDCAIYNQAVRDVLDYYAEDQHAIPPLEIGKLNQYARDHQLTPTVGGHPPVYCFTGRQVP